MVAQLGLTGMESHADIDRNLSRPSLQQEKLFGGAGSAYRIRGAGEYGENAVSFPLGLTTVPPLALTADGIRES
jgi:hypothetical protein